MTLDLTKPLVAVHRHTGAREDVKLAKGIWPNANDLICIDKGPKSYTYLWFNIDGSHPASICPWRIENKLTSAWDDPEWRERVERLLQAVANGYRDVDAQTLLDELNPVDPDLIEAREIAAHVRRHKTLFAPHPQCKIAEKIEAGRWDDHQLVIAALEGLKRGAK